MSLSAVAGRYAQAVFEIGQETQSLEALRGQLADFASAYETSEELREVLNSPVLDLAAREQLLRTVGTRVGLQQTAENALILMLRRRRLPALPLLARRLDVLVDKARGIRRATVISASALPQTYLARLTEKLEAALGGKVVLENLEDSRLIGGMVTRVGDHTFDGSVLGRLHELERRLLSTTA